MCYSSLIPSLTSNIFATLYANRLHLHLLHKLCVTINFTTFVCVLSWHVRIVLSVSKFLSVVIKHRTGVSFILQSGGTHMRPNLSSPRNNHNGSTIAVRSETVSYNIYLFIQCLCNLLIYCCGFVEWRYPTKPLEGRCVCVDKTNHKRLFILVSAALWPSMNKHCNNNQAHCFSHRQPGTPYPTTTTTTTTTTPSVHASLSQPLPLGFRS